MVSGHRIRRVFGLAALMLIAQSPAARAASEQQSLEELRNTVINLLRALVDQGVMTREKAEQLVKQAQDKAAADAALAAKNAAETAKSEEGAVRVPYVPQIVKDEISKQVAEEVKPGVVASVVEQAKSERWGVPGALPEWLTRVRVFGDVTVRAQGDLYSSDNSNTIFDVNAINQAGGYLKAGNAVFLDTTHDQGRFRLRARLGVEDAISPTLTAGLRLASGTLLDPASESQTLGAGLGRYTVGLDQAYIRWNSEPQGQFSNFSAVGGRFVSPWFTPTELVFARDVQFDGTAATVRLGFGDGSADESHVFFTAGAFPIQEIPMVNRDNKWLVAGQLGTDLRWGSDDGQHLRFAAAYYDFLRINGRLNTPDSTLLNYTAPLFVGYGNTVFNIANSTTDSTIALLALAARFRVADLAASYEFNFARYSAAVVAEGVKNLAYDRAEIAALTGQTVPKSEDIGYVAELSFGDPAVLDYGKWRSRVGYRYVRADAVVDSLTDADFHGRGTNARGYYLVEELGVARNTWFRLRYLSANEVDGLRYGYDIVQLDLNARF
ncbi:MAG TPA: putative porin [Steroidobacteraceae bacterium]|jgi:hypothetical protein|nr:putative porin [Steroidobacteraceae bacterium]